MTYKERGDITQEELKRMLDYNPETGIFTWKDSKRKHLNGTRAGYLDRKSKSKYVSRKILIRPKAYGEHRLAWLYVHGEKPTIDIDHINNDATDNRIENLRLATRAQNKQNSSFYKNNKSGYKGVRWHERSKRFRAEIRINGKLKELGARKCPIEAHELYRKAANEHFGEYANYG